MLYVTLSLLIVFALVSACYASTIRSQSRAHARREDLLLNQLLNLAGKPWLPPPADVEPQPQKTWEELLEASRYNEFTYAPEQEP